MIHAEFGAAGRAPQVRPEFFAKALILGEPRLGAGRFHGLNVVQAEEQQLAEAVMVAQQILPAALRADIDLQRADGMNDRAGGALLADVGQADGRLFPDGGQKLQQNAAVERVEHIMVLEPEKGRRVVQLVQQRRADDAQRVSLGEKGDGIRPCVQVDIVLRAAVKQLAAALFRAQQAEGDVFLQLFADGGEVGLPVDFKMAQIFLPEQVEKLLRRAGRAVFQQIQNVKMERDVARGEALGLERVIKRVGGDGAAVHAEEDVFPVRGLAEAHEVAQPALHAAALVVIAAGALFVVFCPAFEAEHIELPHIVADAVEIFDQLAVRHARHLPRFSITKPAQKVYHEALYSCQTGRK